MHPLGRAVRSIGKEQVQSSPDVKVGSLQTLGIPQDTDCALVHGRLV